MTDLTSFHKDKYGAWAGNKNGSPPDPERCAEVVTENSRWGRQSQCSRKRGHGPEGAFCKQHSPEAKAARARKAQEKHEASMMNFRRVAAGRKALAVLEKIADGHNDPRTLAEEFLKDEGLKR